MFVQLRVFFNTDGQDWENWKEKPKTRTERGQTYAHLDLWNFWDEIPAEWLPYIDFVTVSDTYHRCNMLDTGFYLLGDEENPDAIVEVECSYDVECSDHICRLMGKAKELPMLMEYMKEIKAGNVPVTVSLDEKQVPYVAPPPPKKRCKLIDWFRNICQEYKDFTGKVQADLEAKARGQQMSR